MTEFVVDTSDSGLATPVEQKEIPMTQLPAELFRHYTEEHRQGIITDAEMSRIMEVVPGHIRESQEFQTQELIDLKAHIEDLKQHAQESGDELRQMQAMKVEITLDAVADRLEPILDGIIDVQSEAAHGDIHNAQDALDTARDMIDARAEAANSDPEKLQVQRDVVDNAQHVLDAHADNVDGIVESAHDHVHQDMQQLHDGTGSHFQVPDDTAVTPEAHMTDQV